MGSKRRARRPAARVEGEGEEGPSSGRVAFRAEVPGVQGTQSPGAGNPPGLGHRVETPAPGRTWRQKTSGPRVCAHCREKNTGLTLGSIFKLYACCESKPIRAYITYKVAFFFSFVQFPNLGSIKFHLIFLLIVQANNKIHMIE